MGRGWQDCCSPGLWLPWTCSDGGAGIRTPGQVCHGSDRHSPLSLLTTLYGAGARWGVQLSSPSWLQCKHTNGPERVREECGPHSPWGFWRDGSRGIRHPRGSQPVFCWYAEKRGEHQVRGERGPLSHTESSHVPDVSSCVPRPWPSWPCTFREEAGRRSLMSQSC